MIKLEELQSIFRLKIAEILKKKLCVFCFRQLKQINLDSNFLKCSTAKCRKRKSTNSIFKLKPFFNSKIKFKKIIEIIFYFFLQLKVKQIVAITGISKPSIRKIIKSILKVIKKT